MKLKARQSLTYLEQLSNSPAGLTCGWGRSRGVVGLSAFLTKKGRGQGANSGCPMTANPHRFASDSLGPGPPTRPGAMGLDAPGIPTPTTGHSSSPGECHPAAGAPWEPIKEAASQAHPQLQVQCLRAGPRLTHSPGDPRPPATRGPLPSRPPALQPGPGLGPTSQDRCGEGREKGRATWGKGGHALYKTCGSNTAAPERPADEAPKQGHRPPRLCRPISRSQHFKTVWCQGEAHETTFELEKHKQAQGG